MPHAAEIRDQLLNSVEKLRNYVEANDYAGFDPYDALKSPIFQNVLFRKIPFVSFLTQQLIKRFPVNLRPVLGIQKGVNPVTLGLCIQAYTSLAKAGVISKNEAITINSKLISRLKEMIPDGYHGACWGYDFPWQSRYFRAEAFQPSIVATGIITNALFQYFKVTEDKQAKELIVSSASFVTHDLRRMDDQGNGFCFSYTPFDSYPVYNASMKAVRLLCQAWSLIKEESLLSVATDAMRYIMSRQNADGSWYYSASDIGKWIDSYHTGYVLDCADEFQNITGNSSFKNKIDAGFTFFENHFIGGDGFPAFYHNKKYPVDCTSASQIIHTLCRFGKTSKAEQVALFMIRNMQSKQGNFYFRKYQKKIRKEAFMRWSDAWMFSALSRFLEESRPVIQN